VQLEAGAIRCPPLWASGVPRRFGLARAYGVLWAIIHGSSLIRTDET
jgi:hypothetical protein